MTEPGSGIPHITAEKLDALDISTHEVISAIESQLRAVSEQTAWTAPKAAMQPADGRFMMAALAASNDPPVMAIKSVVLNPQNPDAGLPLINGIVTLLDSRTGLPLATLDGNWITAVRTAGLSAVAARKMAKEDASVISFIGCGVQAHSHLKAFSDMFPLKSARLLGRGQKGIEALGNSAKALGLTVTICDSSKDCLKDADLIVSSVTKSPELKPFCDAHDIKLGAFASLTDLGAPWFHDRLDAFETIIIDDLEQEAVMTPKLAPSEQVSGDLSYLVLGKVEGRTSRADRAAFIFRGHGIGDLALSGLAWQKMIDQDESTTATSKKIQDDI